MLKLSDRPVVGRYARGLFAAARGNPGDARRDLKAVVALLAASPDLAAALRHPRLPATAKRDLLKQALGVLSPTVEAFALLLWEKGRWEALPEIVPAFERLADEAAGVLAVRLTTAEALSAVETDRARKALEAAHGGPVRLESVADPALLGGTTLRVGDRVWDNSLKAQLDRLRETLAGTRAA